MRRSELELRFEQAITESSTETQDALDELKHGGLVEHGAVLAQLATANAIRALAIATWRAGDDTAAAIASAGDDIAKALGLLEPR